MVTGTVPSPCVQNLPLFLRLFRKAPKETDPEYRNGHRAPDPTWFSKELPRPQKECQAGGHAADCPDRSHVRSLPTRIVRILRPKPFNVAGLSERSQFWRARSGSLVDPNSSTQANESVTARQKELSAESQRNHSRICTEIHAAPPVVPFSRLAFPHLGPSPCLRNSALLPYQNDKLFLRAGF